MPNGEHGSCGRASLRGSLQLPGALTQAINHFRQIIETVNSQLVEQFQLQRNRAKSVSGLCARVQAKLAAHTLGIYLNYLLGRPLLALMDLALIWKRQNSDEAQMHDSC